MPFDTRNWVARLSRDCANLTAADLERLLFKAEAQGVPAHVRMGLRIVSLRHRLKLGAESDPLPHAAPDPDPAHGSQQMVQCPDAEEQKSTEQGSRSGRKARKASFSSVSLDDAAGLLSAFGGLAEEEPAAAEKEDGGQASGNGTKGKGER